jgi:hypothetical protein
MFVIGTVQSGSARQTVGAFASNLPFTGKSSFWTNFYGKRIIEGLGGIYWLEKLCIGTPARWHVRIVWSSFVEGRVVVRGNFRIIGACHPCAEKVAR